MSASRQAMMLARWHALATAVWPDPPVPPRRTPVGQLIKSSISSRTRDAVSLAAYDGLRRRFGTPARIATAEPREVEAVIAAVTFADVKAERLVAALARIGGEKPNFDLAFLGPMTMAVLNFSTLARPIMVVDTDVLRVLARLGLRVATAQAASAAVTEAVPDWDAEDFRAFHARLKRLGQTLCRWDAPRCEACPLAAACATARAAVARQAERGAATRRLPL